MAERIDIVFGVDDRYAPHVAAVISSLCRTTAGADFRFIVLSEGLTPERRRDLQSVAPQACFLWVDVADQDVPQFQDREHFSRAILYRLGLASLAPADCTRLIYLDADVIVAADLRELWRTDLKNDVIGAVEDCFVDAVAFSEKWNLPKPEARYFNSGVLLIDLARARAEGLMQRALDFAIEHGDLLRFTDQDALNWAFHGRWKRLDSVWNVQRHMVIPSLSRELPESRRLNGARPAIVHFTGPEKPWLRHVYHPWAWIYWRALKGTPFVKEIGKACGVGVLTRAKLWLRWRARKWS